MNRLIDKVLSEDNLFNILGGTDSFMLENIIFNIIGSMMLGLFLYFVYKKTFSGVTYSQNFNVTLVMICMITTVIMMLIGNNLALSLGLVGSLSIIRFRTAVKEPRDISFLFWAIAMGLAAGTGEFMVAIISSIMISFLLFIFNKVIYMDYCYLLVIKGSEIESKEIANILKKCSIPFKLRMKNTNSVFVEITYEINLKSVSEDSLIKTLKSIDNIREVHIVSYNGEVSG